LSHYLIRRRQKSQNGQDLKSTRIGWSISCGQLRQKTKKTEWYGTSNLLLKPDLLHVVDTKTKYWKYSKKYSISGEQWMRRISRSWELWRKSQNVAFVSYFLCLECWNVKHFNSIKWPLALLPLTLNCCVSFRWIQDVSNKLSRNRKVKKVKLRKKVNNSIDSQTIKKLKFITQNETLKQMTRKNCIKHWFICIIEIAYWKHGHWSMILKVLI